MTAQLPDRLINNHPRIALKDLQLYGVICGDPRASESGWGDGPAFAQPARPINTAVTSGLWRGYVATFVLQPDGRLKLDSFDVKSAQRLVINELIDGDFWLVMKPWFHGLRTYIPFKAGYIVEEQVEWFTEEPFEERIKRDRAKH